MSIGSMDYTGSMGSMSSMGSVSSILVMFCGYKWTSCSLKIFLLHAT